MARQQRPKNKRAGGRVFDAREYTRRFVEAAWLQLAAIPWQHYLDREKGVLLLDLTQAKVLAEDAIKCEAQFIAVAERLPASLKGFDVEPLLQAALSYDPEREIAIAFLLPDDRLISFVASYAPPPPEAFLSQFTNRPRGEAQQTIAASN
jgi:hypothetical protein